LLLFASGACSPSKTPQEYTALGRLAVAAGDLDEAKLHLKNALQQDPGSTQARIELGAIYLTQGDLASAAGMFERVGLPSSGAQSPTHVFPLLALSYYHQREDQALRDLISNARSQGEDTLPVALYDILIQWRNGEQAQAEEAFQRLTARSPEAVRVSPLWLYTQAQLQSHNEPADALSTLGRLLSDEISKTAPVDLNRRIIGTYAYLLRGQLHLALRDASAAMKDFERFEARQPKEPLVQILLAATALQLRETERAEGYVDTLLANVPQHPLANTLKAIIAFEKRDFPAAQWHAELSISQGLRLPANLIVAAVAAYHEEHFATAHRHVTGALHYDPENQVLQRLKMVLDYKSGYLEDASDAYLAQKIDGVREAFFGNAMAFELIAQGDSAKALGLLDHLQASPSGSPVDALQAQALRNALAEDAVLPIAVDPSIFSHDEKLLRILMLAQLGDIDGASEEAEQWLSAAAESAPEKVDALNLLAYLSQERGQTAKAASLFSRATDLKADNIPSLLFDARQSLAAGNYNDARTAFEAVLGASPHHLIALRGILRLTFEDHAPPDWSALLAPVDLLNAPDDNLIAVADAAFKWQQPETLDRLLFDPKPASEWSPELWMLWLRTRYVVDGSEGFPAHAKTYLDRHNSLSHALYALSILEAHRDYTQLLVLISGLPDSLQASQAIRVQHAAALVEIDAYDEARALIRGLEQISVAPADDGHKSRSDFGRAGDGQRSRGPIDIASLWYVKGRLKQREGDLVQAASYLRAYYKASPGRHSVTQLASVLVEAQRLDEAVKLALAYSDSHPADAGAILSLGLKLAPDRPLEALELLQSESVRPHVWRNAKLSNNLALLHFGNGDLRTAAIYSENALSIDADNRRIRANHATILVALGQNDEARQLVSEASRQGAES